MAKRSPIPPAEIHTNKVWHTLAYLEPAEHKRLLKYLKSPYFNQSKTLTRLYEILFDHIETGKPGFSREAVWHKLFPKEPYDDVNFRKYCSDLLGQVEGFMAQEAQKTDPSRQASDLLDYVVQHKIEPLYNASLRQARQVIEARPYKTKNDYYNLYLLERQYYTLMDFDVKLNDRSNIEEISHNLDIFYCVEKLKLYSSYLSRIKTRDYNYHFDLINEVIDFLKKYPKDDIPEVMIYYHSFLTLFEEEVVEHYYKLRELLDRYGSKMPQKEAIELYDSALIYCTGKVNKGNNVFFQEYFDLFELAIEKGIFIVNGELASWRFNNVIAAALRLGKLNWAENFVEKYKDYLPHDTRQNTYSFSLARVYLYQKKFDKVLNILRNVDYEDIGYNLISKAMLTITYFELDEFEALDSFVESFRVFLNRHKNIPQARRKSYLNLVKYVRRLTRLTPGDKAAVAKLREEISQEKANTVNHEWLLEKLTEME